MLDALVPGHLRYVDQALDAGFELDEGAVVGQAHDLALGADVLGVARVGMEPRIFGQLLEAQGDPSLLAVELDDLDLDLVAHGEQLGRVVDPPPGHVRDMEQAVDASQIDEGPVVGDVLDHALHDLAFLEGLERARLLLAHGFLEDGLARQHDVAPLLVHLDDAHFEFFAAQAVQVADGAQVDLRAGQEGAHADIDRQAALDALDHAALDGLALAVGALDVVPDLHALGLLAREHDVAVGILGLLQENVDLVADLDVDLALVVLELLQGYDALGLEADVDDHAAGRDGDHPSLDDLSLGETLGPALVGGQKGLEVVVFFRTPGIGSGRGGRRRLIRRRRRGRGAGITEIEGHSYLPVQARPRRAAAGLVPI